MVCELYLNVTVQLLFQIQKDQKKKIHNNYWCQALFIILEEVKQNTLRKHKKLCVSAQLVTEKQPSGITL